MDLTALDTRQDLVLNTRSTVLGQLRVRIQEDTAAIWPTELQRVPFYLPREQIYCLWSRSPDRHYFQNIEYMSICNEFSNLCEYFNYVITMALISVLLKYTLYQHFPPHHLCYFVFAIFCRIHAVGYYVLWFIIQHHFHCFFAFHSCDVWFAAQVFLSLALLCCLW